MNIELRFYCGRWVTLSKDRYGQYQIRFDEGQRHSILMRGQGGTYETCSTLRMMAWQLEKAADILEMVK
jgi:hypothetical protein